MITVVFNFIGLSVFKHQNTLNTTKQCNCLYLILCIILSICLITTHSYGKNSSFALDNLHVRLIFDLDKKK
jgi:hypothetical protein